MSNFVGVVSPRKDVKIVKTCLETASLLNRNQKIKPLSLDDHTISNVNSFVIPTTIACNERETGFEDVAVEQFARNKIQYAFDNHDDLFETLSFTLVKSSGREDRSFRSVNSLHNGVRSAVLKLNSSATYSTLPAWKDLLASLPKAYSIYQPLLLLPPNAFDSKVWESFFNELIAAEASSNRFLALLAQEMRATHIALDAPIPAVVSLGESDESKTDKENVIRSPYKLQPLYGDFGPMCEHLPRHLPTQSNFEESLWVSTCQNGIKQIWSPLYTMFSSGNVTEKARMLQLESVHEAVRRGQADELGSAAVDLFAGIGYFAFSYAKAGVSKVLCWDLNPWSVEGLRRGAAANKWQAHLVNYEQLQDTEIADSQVMEACRDNSRFIVFTESNVHAVERIKNLRHALPPIRHVNCGMLPSADSVWKSAVEIVDSSLGGWIHLHETVFESDVESRSYMITQEIQNYSHLVRGGLERNAVVLEHVEKVKSIGPRLLHVVLDIWIPPVSSDKTHN